MPVRRVIVVNAHFIVLHDRPVMDVRIRSYVIAVVVRDKRMPGHRAIERDRRSRQQKAERGDPLAGQE